MSHNAHPAAAIWVSNQSFAFETPYLDQTESLPYLEVAYETWGDIKNPAILVCHPLSGNTHCTNNSHDITPPGGHLNPWWDAMVGPGRAIDTTRFFVICANMLGGCGGSSGPSSLNPTTNQPYQLTFPVTTIGDMVKSQRMLLEALGVQSLHAVIGGSMGGFQALEWAIQYPSFVERAVVVASSPFSTQYQILTNSAQVNAIYADPLYLEGHYSPIDLPTTGLAIARQIGFTTFISPTMMEQKFAKYHVSERLPVSDEAFHLQRLHEAEYYLTKVSDTFKTAFDPNSMVYLLKTWSHFDLSVKYGSLEAALAPVQAPILIVAADGDNLFPPFLAHALVEGIEANNKPCSLKMIEEDYGHDYFLLPDVIQSKLTHPIAAFLNTSIQF